MTPTPFGAYIRACRLAAGKSLREVGVALGVSHVTVIQVESGKRRTLASRHWPALASIIGADVAELCRLAEPEEVAALRDENARLRRALRAVGDVVSAATTTVLR